MDRSNIDMLLAASKQADVERGHANYSVLVLPSSHNPSVSPFAPCCELHIQASMFIPLQTFESHAIW